MRKIFSLFAALTLSVGLWADATYKADGSKLMAYGVGDYTEANPVTLTIKAPADAMFNGTAIGVTLEGQEAWTNAGLDIPAINYDGIAHVPIMLGNHIATISAGGATASLNYKITTVLNYKSIFDGGIPSGDWVESTNVDWDDIEQCAVFDGNASHLVIQNPLNNVDASTGFSITTEVYISNLNNTSGTYKRKNGSSAYKNGWQRLFDLSNGTDKVYFFLNAGSAAHLRCAGTLNGYTREFQADIPKDITCYNRWHIITLVVAPGGNITLYVDNTVVSYLESNDEIEQILNNIHDYTNCYIGTSIFEILDKGTDGFFFGKIRGFQIAEGPLMPYYDGSTYHYYLGYETNGGNAIAGSFQNNLPNPLPTPTHTDTQKEFAGWYMDAAFTTPAVAGAPLTKNTTLYAKWNVPTPAVGDQFVDETSGLKFQVTAVGETNTVKVINNDYEGTSYTIPASVSYKDVAFVVTEIGDGAFINCSDLTTITFAEGSQVTTIGEAAFNGCWSLISIALPSSVTTIGPNAFSGCSELPSINLASVTEIGVHAFMGCEQLSSLDIPASLTTIGENAFILCKNIYDVTVHWESAAQLPIMGNGVFGGIADDYGPAGATLHVPAGSASVYDVAPWNTFGTIDDPQFVLSDKTAGQYATICLPKPIASVTNGTLYKISYGNIYEVHFVEETNFTADPAGTPYLVQATADGDIVFTMADAEPVTAPISVTDAKGFVASLQEELQDVPEGYNYLLVSGGELHSAGPGCQLSKNHAYIDVNYVPETEPVVPGAPRRVTLYNVDAKSPTALGQMNINELKAKKVIDKGQFVIIRDNKAYNAQGIEVQ